MTREEVLKLTLEASNGKMLKNGEVWWAMNSDAAFKLADAIAQRERESFPDLDPVIAWLENGCDPKEAAKELRLYAEAIAKAKGEA